jgi:uroporphyrinogen decarboxylase
MNHRERFLATINRTSVDRPASWLGMPLSYSLPALFKYFHVDSIDALKLAVDDDIYPIDVPYHSPVANHIACAFPFAKNVKMGYENRTLTAPGFFEDYTDPSAVDKFEWPDPSKYMKEEECRQAIELVPKDNKYAILGAMWSCNFQDACAAFGMEKAFIRILKNPAMFQAVIDKITDFYLEANEIFYKATRGKLDVVLLGNDFGGQKGLLVSPKHIRQFVLSGTKKLIDQAKKYGLKVIHHSCGSIYELIPDLIKVGADALHPVQSLAADMDLTLLKKEFGNRISFCGGVDTQQLLNHGSPEKVKAEVIKLRRLFPTGLIISPSHEALMPDVPPANVEAMFSATHEKIT